MLFSSLFKNDKQISVGRGRKRRLTVRDVVKHLNRLEMTTANCTLIRDPLGNEKVENYGQVDVYRVRDEEVFLHENGFCITTPTGMKIKGLSGGSALAEIVSIDDRTAQLEAQESGEGEGEGEPEDAEGEGLEGSEEETPDGDSEEVAESDEGGAVVSPAPSVGQDGKEEERDRTESAAPRTPKRAGADAFSEAEKRRGEPEEEVESALGIGEVVRLRFFYRRIPYEIDCQIVDRFNPIRFRDKELTPRFGVGYHVRPLSDVRKRDQRRYVRYTHKVGFGHLRMRNEIQFYAYAQRTSLEIPEKGVLPQTLTTHDIEFFPYGNQEVQEVKGADQLERIVEFFMACMISNPSDRRSIYLSKPFLDRVNRSSLEGLGYFSVVGAQQTTILPKIFIKKQLKGRSVLEKQLDSKAGGVMDTRKLRVIEDLYDRYQILTRDQKIWQQRRRKKSVVGSWENDRVLIGFSTNYGLPPDELYTMRHLLMPCEVTDIGVENITLKPIPYEDARARELDHREFVRQEDGIQVELLNFSVGGAQIRGPDAHEETFLQYLVGEGYGQMDFMERLEALQRYAVLLHLYPVLHFVRSDTQDYEPSLPYRIPVLARVARFRTAQTREDEEPKITSLGLEFIFNPILDSYSRDISYYDQWEQITPYTENTFFIAVHKSLQLLFGFDRSREEILREDERKPDSKEGQESSEAEKK